MRPKISSAPDITTLVSVMKKTGAKKKESTTKGAKPGTISAHGPDAHFLSKDSGNLKPLDRAVADAQVYDDMERKLERVRKLSIKPKIGLKTPGRFCVRTHKRAS